MYLPDIYSVIKRKENKNRAQKPCYIEYMYYIILAKSELFRKYFCFLHEIRNFRIVESCFCNSCMIFSFSI